MRHLVDVYVKKEGLINSTVVLPLFEESKTFFTLHQIIINNINNLYINYSYLCSYSHSAKITFQEHHLVFEDLSKIEVTENKNASREGRM